MNFPGGNGLHSIVHAQPHLLVGVKGMGGPPAGLHHWEMTKDPAVPQGSPGTVCLLDNHYLSMSTLFRCLYCINSGVDDLLLYLRTVPALHFTPIGPQMQNSTTSQPAGAAPRRFWTFRSSL